MKGGAKRGPRASSWQGDGGFGASDGAWHAAPKAGDSWSKGAKSSDACAGAGKGVDSKGANNWGVFSKGGDARGISQQPAEPREGDNSLGSTDSWGAAGKGEPQSDGPATKKGRVIAPPTKKAAEVVPSGGPSNTSTPGVAFVVSSKGQGADTNVQRLAGEYIESGSNHERKVYKKLQPASGHDALLYYWDERDGATYSGWWFGTQLGGGEFLARNQSDAQEPPTGGWQVPPGRPAGLNMLNVAPASSASRQVATSAEQTSSGIQGLTSRIVELETTSKRILADANMAPGGPAAQRAEISLKAQQEKAFDVQRQLNQETTSARAAGAPAENVNALTQLSARLRPVLASIVQQLSALRGKGSSTGSGEASDSKFVAAPKAAATPKGQKGQGKDQGKGLAKGGQTPKAGAPKAEATQTAQAIPEDAEAKKKALAEQEAKRKADAEKKQKEAEQRDQKVLRDMLPEIAKAVADVFVAVATASKAAEPILKDVTAELDDAKKARIAEVEAAATKAQHVLNEAKKLIASKWRTVNNFAPDVKQSGKKAIEDQQLRLSDAQKKVTPLKRLQTELQQVPMLKEALATLKQEVDKADAEVREAISACEKNVRKTELSEEDAAAVDKALTSAQESVAAAQRATEGKLKAATGLLIDEFNKLSERASATQEKLKKAAAALRPKLEAATPKLLRSAGADLVAIAEKAMAVASEAEFPFMMGREVLPPDEAEAAFKALDAGIAEVSPAVASARSFMFSKSVALKEFSNKEIAKESEEILDALSKQLEPVAKRFAAFVKSTADRKASALVQEVSKNVQEAEAAVEKFAEAAGVLLQDKIEEVTVDVIKEAIEPSKAASKEAATKVTETRAVVLQKEREAKGAGDFAKLRQRVDNLQLKMRDLFGAVHSSDRLLQSKEFYTEASKKLGAAEVAVDKVEALAGDGELSDAALEKIDGAMKEAQESLSTAVRGLEQVLHTAPAVMRAPLEALSARRKALVAKVDAVKSATRPQREKWQSKEFIRVASDNLSAVTDAMKATEEAELPFLKGLEGMPSKEAEELLKNCELALRNATGRFNEAKAFIAARTKDAKRFSEDVGKVLAEELSDILVKVGESADKLGQFKKDTQERKKKTLLQVAGEKMTAAESDVVKALEAMKPLVAEDMSKLDEKAATTLASKLCSLRDETIACVDDLASFVTELQQATRGDAAHKGTVEGLQKRFTKLSMDGDGLARQANGHMHAFLVKDLLKEVEEQATAVERKLAEVESSAAPLLEAKGASFLDASRLRVLFDAMKEVMKKDSIALDEAFAQVNSGKAITEASFVEYFGKLPGLLGRVNLEYTEKQRKAMFKFAAAGKDEIDKVTFSAVFRETFVCVREAIVTGGFDVKAEDSVVVEKLSVGEVLEATGETKKHEATELVRLPVVVVSSKNEGWVSMSGNNGARFLEPCTPFSEFMTTMEGKFTEVASEMKEVDSAAKKKGDEVTSARKSSALFEVRDDFIAMRKRIEMAVVGLDALKRKVYSARKDYFNAERSDRQAQDELPEQRAADAVFKVADDKVNVVDVDLQKMEEAVAPLSSATEPDAMKAVEKPAALKDLANELVETIGASAAAAREAIKQQLEEAEKGTSRPMSNAKQKLNKLRTKVDAADKRARGLKIVVAAKCKQVVHMWQKEVASAIVADAQKQDLGLDALFDKLASGKARIAEDAFSSYIASLPGLDVPADHVRLIFGQLAGDGGEGVARLQFLGVAQRYYVCVKAIGLTDVFDIGPTKTIRRTDVGEVFEVLEGPKADEASSMGRIRGRALLDNTVGWISVTGTGGSAFLREVPKPCYKASAQVVLEQDVEEDSAKVGSIEADELFEVIEGPVERESASVRLHVKALSDSAAGYVTAKQQGRDRCYRVVSPVVLTDSREIKTSKPIRKLEDGDLLVVVEIPKPSESDPVSRVRVKTQDGQFGWLTPKGDKGTIYAEPSTKHLVMIEESVMTDSPQGSAGAREVRKIAVDEVLEVIGLANGDGPCKVTRVKGRNDAGVVGWVTLDSAIMKKHKA